MMGAELTDEFMERWMHDLGFQGYQLLRDQFNTLTGPDDYINTKFETTRRSDVVTRQHSFVIPAAAVPRKRWAKRTRRDVRWVKLIDDKTKLDTSHWTINGAPVEPAVADEINRDLAFSITELGMDSYEQINNVLEDPDDELASRFMKVMWCISRIGGRVLTNSTEDLVFKRKWIEDIGARALNIVGGVYSRLHEVDRGLHESFRHTATPLD